MTTRNLGRTALVAVLALSMIMSITGGTIAWFTDEVVSANNVITAGNLDVDVYYGEATEEKSIQDVNELFKVDLWEPGVLAYENLTVANKGNLALKYEMTVNATNENTVIENGKGLSSALQIGMIEGGIAAGASREAVLAQVSTWYDFNAFETRGTLLADGEKVHGVVVYWAPKANDNDWNVNNGKTTSDGTALHIDLGVKVVATQLTNEEDSFNDQYDQDADYTPWTADTRWYDANPSATEFVIDTPEELAGLAKLVNEGTELFNGKTIKLGKSINLANRPWTPIGSGAVDGKWIGFNGIFDGQGYTVSNLKVTKGGGWNGLFGLIGRGTTKVNESISNLTVKNVEIEGANRMTGAIVGQIYGNLENCHVENVKITAVPNMTSSGYDNGDKIGGIVGWLGDNGDKHYIENCSATNVSLKAYRDVGGITGYIGSSTSVEDCKVDGVEIFVDQATNSYGTKTVNAGGVIGRTEGTSGTIQNNTEKNVTIIELKGAGNEQDLKAAFANGENVVLTDDIAITGTVTLDAGKNAVLHLNGKTVSGEHEGTDHYAMFNIAKGASLTIEGQGEVKAETKATASNRSLALFQNDGNLTLNGGIYHLDDATEGQTWIIATIVDNRTKSTSSNATVTINGGEYSLGGNATNLFRNYPQQGGKATLIINGGTFKANPGKATTYIWNQDAASYPGELYFNGGIFDAKVVFEDYNGQNDIHIAEGVVINAYSGNN